MGVKLVKLLDPITIRLPMTNKTVVSSTETGKQGDLAYDENYLYVCINTDTWKRIVLSGW